MDIFTIDKDSGHNWFGHNWYTWSIKHWMGPYQWTPMEVARAIWYSCLGVHSVGPVGDFLDMMIDMANVGGWTYSRFPAVITRIGSFCLESQMLFCMSDPENPIYPIFPSKSESWWGPKTHPCHTNRFIHSPLTIYQVLLPSPFYVDGDVFVWL